MGEFNLLKTVPRIRRNVTDRLVNKEKNRRIAIEFGEAYFDGLREQGYGGYNYDGRWVAVARTAADRYRLKSGQHILDIGCAKGFFVHDLMQVIPGLQAFGVEISEYAIAKAPSIVSEMLLKGNAEYLPFSDSTFDAVFSINTIHNLDRSGCILALQEMLRVCKNPKQCFVQVDAYRSSEEKELFEAWMLTAKTYCTPQEWIRLFKEAEYEGDYFWTILEFSQSSY